MRYRFASVSWVILILPASSLTLKSCCGVVSFTLIDYETLFLQPMSGNANRARVRARRCAVQALYQWQLGGQEPAEIMTEFQRDREFKKVDVAYFETLAGMIPEHAAELDEKLKNAIDRDLDKLDPVEHAVLLIGAYELAHCPQIPWRVVINEGVELSKMFGAEEAHKFVNGTLDKLARTLRATEIAEAT